METSKLLNTIQKASQVVGTTWPLYSFVTSNPLSGYESNPFQKACADAFKKTGNITYPEASFYTQAIEKGLLKKNKVQQILNEQKFDGSIEDFLNELEVFRKTTYVNPTHKVDRILVKWLSAFLDEGLADWQMPDKEKGFYKAWVNLAKYDGDLRIPKNEKFPKSSMEVIQAFSSSLTEKEQLKSFENHFAALPGWVGYIKNRKVNNTNWNKNYPLELTDYLAVRMLIAKHLNLDKSQGFSITKSQKQLLLIAQLCLLEVELAWQQKMVNQLELENKKTESKNRPDAQLVFCIDTRSELIRRNIETKGNYETFGYAGFFGIAMDYEVPFSGISRKSCPPILASAYKVTEKEKNHTQIKFKELEVKYKQSAFKGYFLRRMKNILPSAFGFVEGAGLAYAYQLINRTFGIAKNTNDMDSSSIETTCETEIHKAVDQGKLSIDEQAQIVQSAFYLMGFKEFAPLVVFAGHGSHTANNPFASSLDCGACAASPGRHNARMIAKLANSKEVKTVLHEKYGITIPEDTWFLGAEHNTTTDEIILFDADTPKPFEEKINQLKIDLAKARETATAERLGEKNSTKKAVRKSTDWSETRPEWGLAKNAGFVIGPRSLTEQTNLEGQCFLHSYDWKMDEDGSALNAILNGPMVVTQWINNHYYFSTVDNNNYGSGSKITHNITGKFGVIQGNGGDLKTGLPLQSVKLSDKENYHQPQRLSVFVNAPKQRIDKLISENEKIRELIENQWIHLLVINPLENNKVEKFTKSEKWNQIPTEKEPALADL
ncbi:DUF2309 domain-containing protein [Psychroflexus planctonicus]|uniref:Probable inorganic carbon transporter subunit DabA n=1 Tax=Psychroflexus planctonicus TaxID=1526575 RepID=A0ABQ1SHI9_9FLAO|nr:DUF2309 domain-containing protein [Psychroflexus planctonicus]GGE31667.1 UPF0753 protein [Psychroflexus planctonicus]